jgi:hypothetical protein
MQFMQAAGGDMAQAALRAGLVDRIGDRTQFGQRMAELAGTDRQNVPEAIAPSTTTPGSTTIPRPIRAARSGVLTVAGDIVDGRAGPGTAGGETIARNLERGFEEHNLKALVVRVDSPGGSVLASERIRRAILSARARNIPVIVSMGSVAASGGYWIATAADTIFAEPSTITGSIGVFGILPSFQARCSGSWALTAHDAAFGRARSAARPSPEASPCSSWRREPTPLRHLVALRAGCRRRESTRSPRGGRGRRHRPPARPGRPLRIPTTPSPRRRARQSDPASGPSTWNGAERLAGFSPTRAARMNQDDVARDASPASPPA